MAEGGEDLLVRFVRTCESRRQALTGLQVDGVDGEALRAGLQQVRLDAHALAGEATLIGLDRIVEVAGLLENAVERLDDYPASSALGVAVEWWCRLADAAVELCIGEDPQVDDALGSLKVELERTGNPDGWWQAPGAAGEAEPDEARPRVLVLDDSEISAGAMADILEDAGFPAETAHNLVEFEQKLSEFHPEVILSDINMPDIQGDEICRTLKQRYETEGIPIILVSGLPEAELKARAARAGADGWVSKQHGREQLIELLDRLLSEIVF